MVRVKLTVMMLMQFFIWGAWLPLIFGYLPSLGFTPGQQAWILNAFPIAAIVGMFFSNQFADRHFAAEKFMAFSHLVGGVAILSLAWVHTFWPFFLLMLVHCLLYVPTISISNSIAFANMKDPQKEFGPVRMGGTIGWILAAWPFTFILVDWNAVQQANPQGLVQWLGTVLSSGLTGPALQAGTRWTYIVAGIASLLLAAYSLTLPHTPPRKAGEGCREPGLARGHEAAQAPVRAGAVAGDARGQLRAQLATSAGPACSWGRACRRAASAFPGTGSCR